MAGAALRPTLRRAQEDISALRIHHNQTLPNTMLSLRIDQFEFDDPGSEESLEIDVSGQSRFPHPDVKAFETG